MIVTIIHGQSHKQSSYHASRLLVNKLDNVEYVYEFFLPKDLPFFCNGCYLCMEKGTSFCPHASKVQPMADAMDASDLLIFTTPVYCLHTTGSMKAFLDHFFVQWMVHRPKANMFYKQAVILSAGAGTGMKSAAKDIKDSLRYWGISQIHSIYFRSQATTWQEVKPAIVEDIHKKLNAVVRKLQHPAHVSLRTKMTFYMMRMMQIKDWSASEKDKQYWIEQDWIGKRRPWDDDE